MESSKHEVYTRRRTLDLFWQRDVVTDVDNAVRVAHSFLGLRMQCAQCHRHPFDVWTQEDLLGFSNFFIRLPQLNRYPKRGKEYENWVKDRVKKQDARVKELQQKVKQSGQAFKPVQQQLDKLRRELGDLQQRLGRTGDEAKAKPMRERVAQLNQELKPLLEKEAAHNQLKQLADAANRAKGEMSKRLGGSEVFIRPDELMKTDRSTKKVILATISSPLGTNTSNEYRLLNGKTIEVKAGEDARKYVADWFRQPDNPFFARAMANRVWAHYFGRGIIDPPDQLSPLNPPSHPQLLARLSEGFVQNQFDLKWLHRTILNSRTYQQAGERTERNRFDQRNYSVFYLRRMTAEQALDAIDHATDGAWTRSNPEKFVDGGLPNDRDASGLGLKIFGRPTRNPEVICDCERDNESTMVQSLYSANHPEILKKIEGRNAYRSSPARGRVRDILKKFPKDQAKQVEEAFLWTLSRLPTEAERKASEKYLKESSSPERGLQGLLWGLLNTHEFFYVY